MAQQQQQQAQQAHAAHPDAGAYAAEEQNSPATDVSKAWRSTPELTVKETVRLARPFRHRQTSLLNFLEGPLQVQADPNQLEQAVGQLYGQRNHGPPVQGWQDWLPESLGLICLCSSLRSSGNVSLKVSMQGHPC